MLDRLVPEKSARRLALNVHLERRLLGVTTSYEALRLPILVFMNTPPQFAIRTLPGRQVRPTSEGDAVGPTT